MLSLKYISPTMTAAVCAVTLSLALATPSAQAVTISHNGGSTGGIITSATDDVLVILNDLRITQPNTDLTDVCDSGLQPADACLLKAWTPGSQNDIHEMVVAPDTTDFDMVEFFVNASGQPWTDYHIDIQGADIALFEADLFAIDASGNILMIPTGSFTFMEMNNSIWIFFDEPLDAPVGPVAIVFGFYLDLENATDNILITQQPSFPIAEPSALALFGLGLVGLGLARRRKIC